MSWIVLNRTMGARAWMGPPEEELEVELPSEEENEEDLFIFKAGKMVEEGIIFGNAKEMTEWSRLFRAEGSNREQKW